MPPGSSSRDSKTHRMSSFAQFIQERQSHSSGNGVKDEKRGSGDVLPPLRSPSGRELTAPRRPPSGTSAQRGASAARTLTMKTPQLLEYIEEQRGELQARTDSVNAIQRNFERLGEMYRVDRVELEKLREEAQKWRGRERETESERKVLSAMHEQLDDLMNAHKKLKEQREREQEAFRREREDAKRESETLQQRLNTQQELLAEARRDLETLQRAHKDLQSDHNIVQTRLHDLADSTVEQQQVHNDIEHTCEKLRSDLDAQQALHQSLQEELQQKLQEEIQQRIRSEEDAAARLSDLAKKGEAQMHRATAELNAAATSVMQFAAEVQRRIFLALASYRAAPKDRNELGRTISADAAPRDIITSSLDAVYDAVDAACGVVRRGVSGDELKWLIAEITQCEARQRGAFYGEENAMRDSLYVTAEVVKKEENQNQLRESQLKKQRDEQDHHEAQLKEQQDRQDHREAQLKKQQDEQNHREAQWKKQQDEQNHREAELKIRQDEQNRREAQLKIQQDEQDHREAQLKIQQDEQNHREAELKIRQDEQDNREAQLKIQQDEQNHCEAQLKIRQDEQDSREAQLKIQQDEQNHHEAQLKIRQDEQNHREAGLKKQQGEQKENLLCASQSILLREEDGRAQLEAHETDVWAAYSREHALARACSLRESCVAKSHTTHVHELLAVQRRDLDAARALAAAALRVAGDESAARASLVCDWAASLALCHEARRTAEPPDSEKAKEKSEEKDEEKAEEEAKRCGPLGSPAALAAAQRLVDAEEACESAYSCGLCFSLYRRPVTCSPCGHTFCEGCLLGHPQNLAAASEARQTGLVRYCPECGFSACNAVVRVPALQMLSGNFQFRQRAVAELTRILAGFAETEAK